MTRTSAASMLYRLVELLLTGVMEAGRWALYLAAGVMVFSVVSAGYARFWLDNAALGRQMLSLGGFLLVYMGAPLVLAVCLLLFLIEFWRLAWRRPGVFAENGLSHAEFLVYALLLGVAVGYAHVSLHGRWDRLPQRAAQIVHLPLAEARPAHPADPDAGKTPAELAAPGRAGLYVISQMAPSLRAQVLSEHSHSRSSLAPLGESALGNREAPRAFDHRRGEKRSL